MKHQRQIIREEIVKRLTGKTIAGNHVYGNAAIPHWVEDLPVIAVYSRSEDSSKELNQAPRELIRLLNVVVECVGAASKDKGLSDQLDEIAEQVETILSEDDSLDCKVDDIILDATEFQYLDDGSHSTGSVRLIYLVKYISAFPRELGVVDDFKGANVNWDLGPEPDAVVEATDNITIEE